MLPSPNPWGVCHPVGQGGGGLDDVFEISDGVDCPLNAVEVVGLVEPLIRLSGDPVERDREVERRTDQWSRR